MDRPGGRAPRDARGFTTVELVLVMVVIVLLSAMAVPSLSWLSSARSDVALLRLRSAVVLAQEWAMGSGDTTWVVLDQPAGRLSVLVEDRTNPGRAARGPLADPLTRKPMVVRLDSGLASVDLGGTDEVGFDALGVPRGAGGAPFTSDGTIALTGGDAVEIAAGTGLVSIR